jgi:anti-sigma28 factor (negative regulator of flagellin synthesis)
MFRNQGMAADSKNPNAGAAEPSAVPTDDQSALNEKPIPEADPVDIDLLGELREARKDRVAQIKAQIEVGKYESEELLDAALERMVRGIDLTTNDESEEGES